MLVLAWLVAPICSLPQSFIFRLKTHPLLHEYRYLGWIKVVHCAKYEHYFTFMGITNTEV